MNKEALKKATTESLLKKEKGIKTMIGIFIALIIALGFFVIRDYLKTDEGSTTEFVIWICTLGGLASVYEELKAVKEELKSRA